MNNLQEAKNLSDVSEYVQKFARYHPDVPKRPYAVKHPHQYGSRTVSSDDTYDLVTQLCKIYKIRKGVPREPKTTAASG